MTAHRIRITLLVTLVVAGLSGCVSAKAPRLPGGSKQKSNLTPGMVKARVKEGKTTQNDVLASFGAPNIITRDTDGREVWTYDAHYTASAAGSADWQVGGGLVGGAVGAGSSTAGGVGAGVGGAAGKGSAVSQVSSGTFTVMITFDSNGVVVFYRMMSTSF